MNELNLFGVIGDYGLTAADIKSQIADFDQDEPLTVRIDSPGGSVFAGNAIHGAIREYTGPTKAIVESFAGSIASYILTAFDEVEIASNGFVMIHNPTMMSDGDDDAHARDAKLLASIKQDMIAAYSEKMGTDSESVAAMMKSETFFDAAEALKHGIATSVLNDSTASRVVMSHSENLPFRVVASLRCDQPVGDLPKPGETPVAEVKEPVAATVKEIKAAFSKMGEKFILECLEKELPLAVVAEEAAETLMTENEDLKARLEALTSELASVKEAVEAQAAEEVEAVASAKGSQPVAVGNAGPGAAPARVRWSQAVQACVAEGMPKPKAVQAACKRHPGLREEMLSEVNA